MNPELKIQLLRILLIDLGNKLNDTMYPYYNKTRKEAAQAKANEEAFKKLFRPNAQTLIESKQLLFSKLTVEYEKTLAVLVGNLGHDQWEEEFDNAEYDTGEEWRREFLRIHKNKADFARACRPIIAERCSTYVEGGYCKSAEGFDWFGFWDAESVDYLKEAEYDYVCLHRQIRAASIQEAEGCFDAEKNKGAALATNPQKKRKFDSVHGNEKMEDSEESDEGED